MNSAATTDTSTWFALTARVINPVFTVIIVCMCAVFSHEGIWPTPSCRRLGAAFTGRVDAAVAVC